MKNILKIYNSNYWSIYSYNDIKKKNRFKFDLSKIDSQLSFQEEYTKEVEIERISLSRTKNHIKELVLCNDFDYFMTWTIDSQNNDRFNLQKSQEQMKKLMHRYKRKNKDFKFLFITEKHESGAFHFHGVVSGLLESDLYTNENGYLSSKLFDTLGFHSISKIKDLNKVGNYITKYITKECVRNEDNQIYFRSRGLKFADKQELNYPIDYTKFDNVYTNDYIIKKDLDIYNISYNDKLYLLQIFNNNVIDNL